MKVILVQPRVSSERAYPLGLATLIPHLTDAGHSVEGIDLHRHTVETLAARARSADAVGFYLPSVALETVRQAIATLRRHDGPRRIPIVVGGPHPTLFPEEALAITDADAAVVGDGEEVLPRVLGALAEGRRPDMAGVVWAHTPRGGQAPSMAQVDLDAQPFADRTVFPIARYTQAMRSAALPYTTVVTSRGCLGACPFCPGPRLNPVGFRARSPAHVQEELEALARIHGVRSVHIEDDDFFADRARVITLCDRLRRTRLDLVWEVVNGVPPERLDEEMIRTIALAGCRTLVLSVEIVVRDHADGVTVKTRPDGGDVRYRLDAIRRIVTAGHRVGITMAGYFILGMPGRTLRQDLQSVGASYRLGLDRADYSAYQWIPGSRDWHAGRRGRTGPRGEVEVLRLAAQSGFYLRPGPFRRLLHDVKRQPEVLGAMAVKIREQARILARSRAGGP